ncbi:MAG: hypothetical protein RJB01_396 [Actinomycetota bacterium]
MLAGPGIVPLAALFTSLAPLSTDVYLPVLPQLAETFGASQALATGMITAVLLGLAVGQIIGGPLSDQRGRRPVLLWGLGLFVFTTFLSGIAPSIEVLLGIRFASGIAASLSFVVARAMLADCMHGVQLARGYALLGAITGIAPVVAPIFGGVLALFMGWRGIFIALAAVSILLVLVAYLKVPETLPSDKRGDSGLGSALSDIGLLFANRAFMAYVLMIACGGGMLFAYLGSSSFILVDGFGFSPTLFSIVFAINSVGIFVLAFWGRHLVTRTGPNRLLWWGQAITFVGSVLVFIGLASSVLAVLLVGFFLAIAANTWVFANATAIGFDVAPARAGAASAMLGVAGFAVGGLLAPLTGMGTVALGVMMVIFTGGGLLVHQFVARPYLARST